MSGDRRISLKVDLSTGSVEIDAPADVFELAVDKAKEVLGALPKDTKPRSVEMPSEKTTDSNLGVEQKLPERAKSRSQRSGSTSTGRTGRIGSFEPIDLGFSESQERELRAFMDSKSPAEQIDQVAVALYKGEQLLNRKAFAYNEIYTLLRLSGIKELPKALDVVISRMIENQHVIREGAGFSLKFIGRDRVERDLGPKVGGKS